MTVEDFAARLEAVRKAEAEPQELVFNPRDLNWAIEGWQRLQDRKRFQQPASSAEAIEELADLGSPIGAFLRERCTVAPGQSVPAQTLFDAWSTWCQAQGRGDAGTVQTFGRDLRAVVPGLRVTQSRSAGLAKGLRRRWPWLTR